MAAGAAVVVVLVVLAVAPPAGPVGGVLLLHGGRLLLLLPEALTYRGEPELVFNQATALIPDTNGHQPNPTHVLTQSQVPG